MMLGITITHFLFALVLATAVHITNADDYLPVPYRINAGFTTKISDSNNLEWSPDKYFNGGKSFKFSTCMSITDPKLYCSERFGKTFSYKLPLQPDKAYTIDLHFAEFFHKDAGKRIFNVTVQGKQVAVDMDLIEMVGYRKPHIISVKDVFVSESDPSVTIVMKSSIDNAKISGIAIDYYNDSVGPLNALVRINAGGTENWIDPISNVVWQADAYYFRGDTDNNDHSICREKISGTSLDPLACDIRYSHEPFSYIIPMKPGDYIVRLLFSHLDFEDTDMRPEKSQFEEEDGHGGGGDQPIDQPVDNPVFQPVFQPIFQPIQQPVDQPAFQPVGQPADLPVVGQPVISQPFDQPAFQPVGQPADLPVVGQPVVGQPVVGQPVQAGPQFEFDVFIQDELVVRNLNVFELTGFNKALVISYFATVHPDDTEIVIKFIPTSIFAFVQAIEIVRG